jgi:hypothetical protein
MRNRILHDELERLVGWMVSCGMPREEAEEMTLKSIEELRKNMSKGWDEIKKEYLKNHEPIAKGV